MTSFSHSLILFVAVTFILFGFGDSLKMFCFCFIFSLVSCTSSSFLVWFFLLFFFLTFAPVMILLLNSVSPSTSFYSNMREMSPVLVT